MRKQTVFGGRKSRFSFRKAFFRGIFLGSALFVTTRCDLEDALASENLSFTRFERNPFEFSGVLRNSPEDTENPGSLCEEKTDEDAVSSSNILPKQTKFKGVLDEMLADTPIGAMTGAIAARDRETAAFLVAIAKKESSWGKRAPSLDGRDCFNYWGFKGTGSRGTGMGYACFGTPEEAVEAVGNRLAVLIHEKRLNSPERLVVWKCGSSCAGHDSAGVAKWIADVRSVYMLVKTPSERAAFSESGYNETVARR